MIFDTHYRERLELDGMALCLRLLRPEDSARLYQTFHHLSPQSRYRRFLHLKEDLSEDELRFFAEPDGWQHFALAAFAVGTEDEDTLLGEARFMRLTPQATVAEVALAVLDNVQGRGLGRLLLTRLVAAAGERGVERLRFYLLYENRPARCLLESSVWETTFDKRGTVAAAELKVPDASTALAGAEDTPFNQTLDELLHMIARGAVASPISLSLLGFRSWWRETQRALTALHTAGAHRA